MKNFAPALVLMAASLGFNSAAQACNDGRCGGQNPATGGTQTVDVNQQTKVNVVANPTAISGSVSGAAATIEKGAVNVAPVIKGSTATIEKGAVQNTVAPVIAPTIEGSKAAAIIQEGAVQTENTNLNKNDNKSSATIEEGAVRTGDQIVNINGPKIPKGPVHSAIAPTIISGGVVTGISTSENPYASCFREKENQRSFSAALTIYTASVSGGVTPEKEDNEACRQRIDQLIADKRLEATGRTGQAAVVRRDLDKPINIELKNAVTTGKTLIQSCPHADPVELELTGICPAAPIVEDIKKFNQTAQGVVPPVAAQPAPCPAGTRRDPVTLECKRG